MAKIIFKQKAIDDLNAIWEYTFEKWSEKQDDTYYEALKFDCLQIGKNRFLGKEYTEICKGIFGLKSGKHIIFYQLISDETIEIIRILHQQMDLKNRIRE